MSTKLKRIVEALAVAALSVAVLAALPGTAEAQGTASTEAARGTDSVVVAPGDSLWSISQERLGPQATPPRIYREVGRIYALNRNRIGPDPDLIFPGQELVLPPTTGQPASARATLPREATGAAPQAGPNGRAVEGEAEQAARTARVDESRKAPSRVVETPNLPDAVEAPAVGRPAVDTSPRSPVASLLEHANSTFESATSALGETFAQIGRTGGGRLLLVVGTWLLTFALVVLMVWKLPVRRDTRLESERWGIPTGYGTPGYGETSLVRRRSRRSPAFTWAGRETGFGDRTDDQTSDQTGGVRPPERRRAGPARAPNGGPSPSGGLALGAHDPRIRRAALRGRTRPGARKRKARAASSKAARRPRTLLRPGRHSRPNERGVEQ